MIGEVLEHAHSRYVLAGLLVALLVIALLVNLLRPTKRRMLRRTVILYAAAVAVEGVVVASRFAESQEWETRLSFLAHLTQAFVAVNLLAIAIFDLLLPAVVSDLPEIASELSVAALYILATLTTLSGAGVNASSVLGASAVVSAVLALSLQSTLGNVIGGVAIQLDGSIHVGDWIQLENGRQGKVKAVRWRHTILETRDWGTLIVPNSSLLQSQILVLAKREGQPQQHRYWVYFNVDFRFAPSRVIRVVNDALQEGPIANVALDPKPHCIVFDFSRDGKESFAYYAIRYWLTDLAVDDPTNSAVRQRLYMALKRADIPLARPATTNLLLMEESESSRHTHHHRQRIDALEKMELFVALTPLEREELATHLVFAPFCAGEFVTRKGKVAHWLYVLIKGEVDIQLNEGGTTKLLSTIDAPGFFGEMGMMTGEPRAADVVAKTDVECYRLDKYGFEKVMLARPELAKAMSNTMAERRAELVAARDGMAADQKARFKVEEQQRILKKIEQFFGLA